MTKINIYIMIQKVSNEENLVLLHQEGNNYFEVADILKIPLSTIVYGKFEFLLEQLKNIKTGFLIVPAYQEEQVNKIQIQLAVTGKCKSNEIPLDAFKREVAEELGIEINLKIENIKKISDPQNELYFSLVKQKNIKSNLLQTNYQSKQIDNPKKKIICWIYTEEIDEELIFSRCRRNSSDDAGKLISIIPVELMKIILEKWLSRKVKKISRFSFILKN